MGNTQPTTSEEGDDPFDGIDTLGYRVLGVQPDSPASQAGLVSFLDFLLGANERMLLGSGEGLQDGDEYDDVDLPGLLAENKGKPVEFCKCVTDLILNKDPSVVSRRPALSLLGSFWL